MSTLWKRERERERERERGGGGGGAAQLHCTRPNDGVTTHSPHVCFFAPLLQRWHEGPDLVEFLHIRRTNNTIDRTNVSLFASAEKLREIVVLMTLYRIQQSVDSVFV